MIIATWNVNSLKVRLPHVLDWLAAHRPDVLCLQETKLEDRNFPVTELATAGYQALFSGQKAYNGVALLGKTPGHAASAGILGFADEQKRVLAASYGEVRVVCAYFPNGQSLDSDKYQYKLRWLEALTGWLREEMKAHPKLALLGDFNIAPEDRDVYDPAAWEGNVLVSPRERAAFAGLQALGLRDAFRLTEQEAGHYSWWDYRMGAFRRNLGLRIDHILLAPMLSCSRCWIDQAPRALERPSDHAPVIAAITG